MDRFRTTTALPFAHLSMATARLREQLGRQLLDDDRDTADWSTLRIVGPFETFDRTGQLVYEYRASVKRRPVALANRRPAAALR